MKPSDIPAELSKAINALGLNKDVVDMLRTKAELLEEKVETLEAENSELRAQLRRAEKKIQSSTQAITVLDDQAKAVLVVFLSDNRYFSAEEVASRLSISENLALHYFDVLTTSRLIVQRHAAGINYGSGQGYGAGYGLTAEGRAYAVKNGIAI